MVLAAIRIGWHLPMMLTGQLPWLLGTLGNAGFQLVLLCLYRFSGDRWSTAAVAHASLNVLGGRFLFQMVTGADRARLGLIMAVAYALLGLALAAVLARVRLTTRRVTSGGRSGCVARGRSSRRCRSRPTRRTGRGALSTGGPPPRRS